ncbi:MAG: hypothetical protein IKF19_03160 [Bacilli bacterium]|nr:hypothetical protein [Bacilli bacterium]
MDSNTNNTNNNDVNTNKEKYAILAVAAIILLGITYAIQNSSSIFKGRTATIKIDEEAYGDTEFDNTNIKFIPIKDDEVEISSDNVIRIDFRVGGAKENTDKNDIIYDIALNDLEVDCNLISPYLKWKLLKNDEEISNGSFDYKFDTIRDKRLVLTTTQQDLIKYSSNKDDYDRYTFYIWLSDNCQTDLSQCKDLPEQTNLLNKRLNGKIEIELNTGAKVELKRHPSEELDTSICTNNNEQKPEETTLEQ